MLLFTLALRINLQKITAGKSTARMALQFCLLPPLLGACKAILWAGLVEKNDKLSFDFTTVTSLLISLPWSVFACRRHSSGAGSELKWPATASKYEIGSMKPSHFSKTLLQAPAREASVPEL